MLKKISIKYWKMRRLRSVLLSIFFICLSIQGIGQQISSETHKVLVRVVLTDVVVVDKNGNFVFDLTNHDFELYEDGKPRPINSVQLITREFIYRETPEIKSKDKIYVIFDCLNTDHITFRRAKPKILSLLNSLLKEGLEVKIIVMDKEKGIRTISESIEPQALEEIISKIEGSKEVLLWEIGEEIEVKTPYSIEKIFWRERIQKTIWYLLQVISLVRAEQGKKSILLISKGLPEKQSMVFDDPGWSTRIKVFDPFNIIQRDDYIDIINELIKFANTNRISFYCIDLSHEIEEIEIESNFALSHLSERTGGAYYRGKNNFQKCEEVFKRTFSYYEIAYTPSKAEEDGKFHKIEVRVKRKGVKVFFREGYIAYKKEDLERINLASAFLAPSFYRAFKLNCSVLALPQSGNHFRIWGRLDLPLEQFRKIEDNLEKVKFIFGIKEITKERIHYGEIEIDISEETKRGEPYLNFYFGTKEIKIKPGLYEISAVVKDETGRIGAWEGRIEAPDLKKEKEVKIINFILGTLLQSSKEGKPFTLSERDALLRAGKFKFIPSFENLINREASSAILVQIFIPENKKFEDPIFLLEKEGQKVEVDAKLIEKHYDKKTKCFLLVYALSLRDIKPEEYDLQLTFSSFKASGRQNIKIKII